jgi:sigma-B regulation protein RsbU (phosphoserine phosphatase)
MTRLWRQYALLVLIFAWAAFFEGGNIAYVFRTIAHPADVPAAPFSIMNATRTIGSGPFFGDEILSLNGHPFTAKRQYDDIVSKARPGDQLKLVLTERTGRTVERNIVIGDQVPNYNSAASIALTLCLVVFVPVVCLGLGFAVAFIRPRDGNAWLLLFLLVGFSGLLSDATDWRSPFPDLQLLWTAFCNSIWAVSMMLFSICFPRQFGPDRRYPWVKYLFLVPAFAVESVIWAILWMFARDIGAAQQFRGLLLGLSRANLVIQMAAIGIFFAMLGLKSGTESSPDERRRLRILWTGATLSFTPMFPIVLYAVIRHQDVLVGVPWPFQALAFSMMALFPVTLAYVIVVERAMDLSFVVRQSVQYALARGGVRALRIGLIVLFANMATNSARGSSAASWARTLGIGIVGIALFRQRAVTRASAWVDRRFFREAYDAEMVLSELAVEAGRYLETEPLLEKVAGRISGTLHVPDLVVLIREGDVFRTRFTTRAGEPMDIAAGGRIAEALRESDAPLLVYFDDPQPWIQTLSTEEIRALDSMHAQLLLPLKGRRNQSGQITGILSLGPKLSEAPYSATDIQLLQAVAWQMGMALENSSLASSLASEAAHREVMNRELEIAREVQERLFPQKVPKIAGVDCHGYCRPARGVGGDYYDFIELPEGKLGIAIGDVSGKGIAAALLMASLQASLRGQAMAEIHDLSELMRNVNKLVYDASQSNRYATFFYGEFDPATRHFSYVNAGHNAPIVLRGGEVLRLEASGPVVGLLPGVGYTMDSCQLQPGDIFIGYTDGISEAMNEQDEEWEEERFISAARACARAGAKEMIEGIFRCVDVFTGSAKQYDDMTLLVMKLAA